jgi:hypothetical protein
MFEDPNVGGITIPHDNGPSIAVVAGDNAASFLSHDHKLLSLVPNLSFSLRNNLLQSG